MAKLEPIVKTIVEIDLDFVIEHGITFEQYVICYLLWQDQRQANNPDRHLGGESHLSYVYKYFLALKDNDRIEGWKIKDIEHLEDIGFLINRNPTGKYSADLMEVTPVFINAVMTTITEWDELWDAYPARMVIEPGRPQALLKSVKDRVELQRRYLNAVKTKKKHREVMELLEWGKENNQVNLGIEKFVNSYFWEILQDIKAGDSNEASSDHETVI